VTNEIQQTRYDRMVRRVAGIIGPGSKVAEVITELFPFIDVEKPPAELYLLGGTVLGMGAHRFTGAAGQVPKVQLFNPLDSGLIVTVTDVYFSVNAVTQIRLARETVPLTAGNALELARDTRQILTNRPGAQMRSESAVAFIGANMIFRPQANVTTHIRSDNDVMVLSPGNGITISTELFAAQIIVTYLWRERPAEPSELQF